MAYSLDQMEILDLNNFDELNELYHSLNHERDVSYTFKRDGKALGYVVIKIISQMNEFKLGKMLIKFEDESNDEVVELFNDFLRSQIIDNYMLKITTDIEEDKTNTIELLKKLGFIYDTKTTKVDGFTPLKITKPIFLERS